MSGICRLACAFHAACNSVSGLVTEQHTNASKWVVQKQQWHADLVDMSRLKKVNKNDIRKRFIYIRKQRRNSGAYGGQCIIKSEH